jgi:hypothetical protein
MKRLWLLSVCAALLASLLVAAPARADTPYPDSTPTLEQVDVYRNLLETGDSLYVIYANIPYATPPDTDITDTFIVRLIDTDGTTVLGSTVGYAFNDDGYGYNVWSMYFPAADGLVWEALYTLRLSGNPAVFVTPPIYNVSIAASDYTDLTTQAENRSALAVRILALADDLDNKWGLAATASLLVESEAGTVLSIRPWRRPPSPTWSTTSTWRTAPGPPTTAMSWRASGRARGSRRPRPAAPTSSAPGSISPVC